MARCGVIAYLVVIVMLLWMETTLIYPAPQYPVGDWNDAKTYHWEDVTFQSSDGTKLNGWYHEVAEPQAYLLYCHGNGENVSYLGEYLAGLSDRYQINIFAFDYRGYGRSEGSPHEAGILADGDAAQRWLAERAGVKPNEVVLMGRSLGGGVAVDLAARNGARGLILQNTFSSLFETAAYHYPIVPVRWLMRNRYNSVERIAKYSGPLLQSHGDNDSVVPFELGKKLHAAAVGPKQFFVNKGLGHNDGDPQEYRAVMAEFLKGLSPSSSPAAAPSATPVASAVP